MLEAINGCIIVPTYNNHKTLEAILLQLTEIARPHELFVVNDGSTDNTSTILSRFEGRLTVITNSPNQGKGVALRRGFKSAIEAGFSNAITIDSDGQHFPEDIPLLIEQSVQHPGSMIMGSRNMEQSDVPGKSSFGNKFSNFWFTVETGIRLPDTQTGFRLYPLTAMKKMRLFTRKFELEIEVIVRLAWKKVKFIPVPVRVLYDMEERVSHFRPARDFFRISVLNTVLVIAALLYYYPKKFFSTDTFRIIRDEAIKPQESNAKKAISIAFGIFMGIFPIWGFQLIIGIPLAILFRMNKVLFIAAANISIPPMIPLILFTSFMMGKFLVSEPVEMLDLATLTIESIHQNFVQYFVGAIGFATISFFLVFGVTLGILKIFRKEPVSLPPLRED